MEVDFSDVLRQSARDKDGEFVDDLADPIQLGPKAMVQVRQIFWRHGLQRFPATYGELLGNYNYCRLVSMWLWLFSPTEPAGMRECAFADHEEACPGRGKLLGLLADGALAEAWALHQAQGVYERNAGDRRLTKSEPQPRTSGS